MRLPASAHASRPWRIHALAHDFRLEDVWQLPGELGPGDFERLVGAIASFDPARSSSAAVRALFAIRAKAGWLLGWDGDGSGLGARVPSLRERLPADLRDSPAGPAPTLPFSPLFLTADEWAAEAANATVHGVLHLGRVPHGTGGLRAQLAILVKPNGRLGEAYMAAIKPFRQLIVYPSLMRELERAPRA